VSAEHMSGQRSVRLQKRNEDSSLLIAIVLASVVLQHVLSESRHQN
jgi:hypothetical protein